MAIGKVIKGDGSGELAGAAERSVAPRPTRAGVMNAEIFDGTTRLLETLDWEHATVERFERPYYQFASGKLNYACQYHNTTDQPLKTGESAFTDEMCMAFGVFFPAKGDVFCLNSIPINL